MSGRLNLRAGLVWLALLGMLPSLGSIAGSGAGTALADQEDPPVLAVVEVRRGRKFDAERSVR